MYLIGSNGNHRGGKASIYEGGIHIPFIIRWKSMIKSNQIIDNNIYGSTVDLYRTIIGLTKDNNIINKIDKKIQGNDLSCIFFNNCNKNEIDYLENEKSIIWENRPAVRGNDCIGNSPRFGIRKGNYKLYCELSFNNWKIKQPSRYSSLERIELYNVVNDPIESRDLLLLIFGTEAYTNPKIKTTSELPQTNIYRNNNDAKDILKIRDLLLDDLFLNIDSIEHDSTLWSANPKTPKCCNSLYSKHIDFNMPNQSLFYLERTCPYISRVH